MDTAEEILVAYDGQRKQLRQAKDLLCDILRSILTEQGVRVHDIEGRVKKRDSLVRKLSRPDARFHDLNEVHDVIGTRVITYFEDEVTKVDSALRQELLVDQAKSGDRGSRLGAREFGYRSVHIVGTLDPPRARLTEYKVLKDRIFEVQIRSILQHAWAEIEHDLGYKNPNSVPDIARRRFSRVAAFLETADEDFLTLRTQLREYEQQVMGSVEVAPEAVEINGASLRAFLKKSQVSRGIDERIAELAGATISEEPDPDVVEKLVSRLQALGLKRIEEVANVVDERKTEAIRMASQLVPGTAQNRIRLGTGLYYILFSLLSETDEHTIRGHLDQFMIGPPERRELLLERIEKLRRDRN